MSRNYVRPKINFWSILILFAVFLTAFLLLPRHEAKAADAGEYVWFRIDTELDVLNGKGITVEWSCNGTASGSIIETAGGIASESTQLIDGIVKVASASKEMTDATCVFNTSDTINGKVSVDGWITRKWTASLPASTSAVFTTMASMDYNLVVYPIKDELDTTLTLNGTAASASYSGATASVSYSNYISSTWKRYIAATADGTLTGGGDGYVNKTVAVTWSSSYGTTSKSADFDSSTTSTYNGDQLPFGHKIQVYESGGDFTNYKVTSGTVTAGNSYGTACTIGTSTNAGYWYCPVPLANTETTARFIHDNWNTATGTYTDRSAGSAAQTTATINPTRKSSGGGSTYVYEATPTPSPEATPEVTPTPTPEVLATPTPTPAVIKLYRKVNDPKVYVQGADGLLTWVRTLEDFNAAGYKWSDVQVMTGAEFAQLKIAPTSIPAKLFRKASDPKVYVQGEDGTLTWVKTLEDFNAAGYNWADVQVISGSEFAKMRVGGQLRVVKGIGYLRVRAGPSIAYPVLGKVLPDQELKFTEISNGWYRIDSGWVSGAYAREF